MTARSDFRSTFRPRRCARCLLPTERFWRLSSSEQVCGLCVAEIICPSDFPRTGGRKLGAYLDALASRTRKGA